MFNSCYTYLKIVNKSIYQGAVLAGIIQNHYETIENQFATLQLSCDVTITLDIAIDKTSIIVQ